MKHVSTPAAYQLFHSGTVALSQIEAHGVRVDKDYLERAIRETSQEIAAAEDRIRQDPDFSQWRRRFAEPNPGSYKQLSEVLFKGMGLKPKRYTPGSYDEDGKLKADARAAAGEDDLDAIDVPMAQLFSQAAKTRKIRDFLKGIQREIVRHDDGGWYAHCSYNLNTVITFRSSVDLFNYQNQPKRNPRMAEVVRKSFIARDGCQLGEVDYGQLEARSPCPYCEDPVLMAYMSDPNSDIHRDMASQIFKCSKKQVSKAMRNAAKGPYVFATFYGSFYGLTAPALWEDVDKEALKLEGGTPLRDHLTSWGMTDLGEIDNPTSGTWCAYIKSIDEDFWGKRFKVYAQWKRDWWETYCREGGFTMLTGFAVHAPLDKKQVCNSPCQGSGFHLLLWSMIQLNNWLRRYKMKSRIIGEIHDSITLDLDPSERDDVFAAAQDIMTKRIVRQYAPWMNVPLICEPEVCPVGGTWFDLQALKESEGVYLPASMDKWTSKFGPWVA